MYLRAQTTSDTLLDGVPIAQAAGRASLYSTAYPFKVCKQGGPGRVAFVTINGQNPAVSALADIADANNVRTLPTAAFTVAVSSGNANDTVAGTGAQKVEVDVLDTNYQLYTLSFDLAGQTKVTDTVLGANALRINDIRITQWGTGLQNAGVIYVYDSSDTVTSGVPQTASKIFGRILATANVSRGGFYTVPAGCKLQLSNVRVGVNDSTTTARAGSVSVKTQAPIGGRLITSSIFIPGQLTGGQAINCAPAQPLVFDEKTDITFQATMSAAAVVALCADAVLFYK